MSAVDWRTQTPAEVLEGNVVLTMDQTAYVLGLTHSRGSVAGKPDGNLARKLVRADQLRLVQADAEPYYWRVSAAEVRRYLAGEPVISSRRAP